MARSQTDLNSEKAGRQPGPVSLKSLADYLGLSPATVSLVINRSPAARTIPKITKDRIFAAAKLLNYRPNYVARSLRTQRSFTIGVVVPEISEGYASLVLSGIENYLLQQGYFYFVVSHRHRMDLIDDYARLLLGRSVEGLIGVDTPLDSPMNVPTVAVSGHREVKGITNIVLDHDRAATLALTHLQELGHQRIAFIKGQEFSSDTETRWSSITEAASRLHIEIDPRLVVQLEGDIPSPQTGYLASQRLLERSLDFTALFAFNDISAIGATHALRKHGLKVPMDVSVVGFDDIQSAAFQNPSLTTIHQPLQQMGEIAAKTVLSQVGKSESVPPAVITVEPKLVIRESTARRKLPR